MQYEPSYTLHIQNYKVGWPARCGKENDILEYDISGSNHERQEYWGCHFANDIFKWIFFNENLRIFLFYWSFSSPIYK